MSVALAFAPLRKGCRSEPQHECVSVLVVTNESKQGNMTPDVMMTHSRLTLCDSVNESLLCEQRMANVRRGRVYTPSWSCTCSSWLERS